MGQLTVRTQRRGRNMKLILSVMRKSNDNNDILTTLINIDNLAEIYGTVQPKTNNRLSLRIAIKKCEAAKDYTVLANIVVQDFDKQFQCPDEWMEVTIKSEMDWGECCSSEKNIYIYLYTVVVDITVEAKLSTMSVANNLLYEDNEFTDFQLHSADGTVAVHKAILAVHGDMFKTMLRGEWRENEQGSININGVSVQTLQHLKEYMYLGTLPDEGLENLLLIADPYLMEKLEDACITKLIKTLKPEKFDSLIEFACQNNMRKLMRALVLGIPDNIVNGIHQLEQKMQGPNDEKKL